MIRPLAFIDTHSLAALLYVKRSVFESEQATQGPGDSRILDGTPLLKIKEWSAIKSAASRVLNALTPMNGNARPDLVYVGVEKLAPQGIVPWSTADASKVWHFRVPVVTNAACMDFCGLAGMNLPAGQLAEFDIARPHSALNLGETPRYQLIVEVRRPAPAATA